MSRFLPALVAALVVSVSSPVSADTFRQISERDTFVNLIKGKQLRRIGITLRVSEAGQIVGRAFGRNVTGQWQWSDDGYFCRDLFYGKEALGPNCQRVEINGDTLRFTSDRGRGIYADLRLR